MVEKTLGVVAIMGNHYGGQYDPAWEIDKMLQELNAENGWQVGIHVDAASGGFTAPFQEEGLSVHVAISVSYLGGNADSYTLTCFRHASGICVQYYKFHRVGKAGYKAMNENRMSNAQFLRDALRETEHEPGWLWPGCSIHQSHRCSYCCWPHRCRGRRHSSSGACNFSPAFAADARTRISR